jgi:hypothetical protein
MLVVHGSCARHGNIHCLTDLLLLLLGIQSPHVEADRGVPPYLRALLSNPISYRNGCREACRILELKLSLS